MTLAKFGVLRYYSLEYEAPHLWLIDEQGRRQHISPDAAQAIIERSNFTPEQRAAALGEIRKVEEQDREDRRVAQLRYDLRKLGFYWKDEVPDMSGDGLNGGRQ